MRAGEMDESIVGVVKPNGNFVCRPCIEAGTDGVTVADVIKEDVDELTVVLSTDDWKSEVGPCSCGNFAAGLS